MTLETTNPHCFTYKTEELLIELLGGIRIDTLDRMRVTIKVTVVNRKHKEYLNNEELAGLSVRHNLDLYNDTQVEKFIRRIAEKLETGSIALTKAIADITGQLEQYRLTQLDKQETRKEKALSKEEREEAIRFLEQKDLLNKTNEMIGKSGVIGEETNRLLMYLIFTSRKREHPLHIISLGNSGIGKTYLQEKVGELIPEEDKVEITTLSENALYYFGQRELQHRLVLIEDLDGAEIEQNGQVSANKDQGGETYPAGDGTTQGFTLSLKNDVGKDQKRIGSFHTHTEAAGIGSPISVAVEGYDDRTGKTVNQQGDLFALSGDAKAGNTGAFVMVENEAARYAFVITDAALAKDFLANPNAVMNTYTSNLKESSANGQVNAIMATIGDGSKSGIALYQTAEGDKNRWTRVMAK